MKKTKEKWYPKPVKPKAFSKTERALSKLITGLIWLFLILAVSNIFYLSAISLFKNWPPGLKTPLYFLSLIAAGWFLKKYFQNFQTKISGKDLFFLIPYLVIILLRFPLYYPPHDDLAYHLAAGDYGRSIWFDSNFMPLDFSTYYYPGPAMIYFPFLSTLGIRITIFLSFLILSFWMLSLLKRYQDLVQGKRAKFLISAFFIIIVFTPHLMATHGSLMTDFLALVISLETLCQFLSKKKDKTLAVILTVIALLTKPSSLIFIIPPLLPLWLKNFRRINWKISLGFIFFTGIYFFRLYLETGNPLFGLYNKIFKSCLYAIANFKDPRWGPQNLAETLAWPIIGQFTSRYGEGEVLKIAKAFFGFIPIIGYLGSFFLFITWLQGKLVEISTRSRRAAPFWCGAEQPRKYLFFVLAYLLWALISGYSRYYLPLNGLVLISLILDSDKISLAKSPPYPAQNRSKKSFLIPKNHQLVIGLVIILISFSSLATDFGWRPNLLVYLKDSHRKELLPYFWQRYYQGWSLVFKDRIPLLAKDLQKDFQDHQAIVFLGRGEASFYSYLGSLNGLKVIQAVSHEEYQKIFNDPKISLRLKNNLQQLDQLDWILVVKDPKFSNEKLADLYVFKNYDCNPIDKGGKINQLQNGEYFSQLALYSCQK